MISPGAGAQLHFPKRRKKTKEANLLSVRPPVMLDGVSVFRCWGFMSWLTEGSLLTFPWVGEQEP